MKDFYYQLKVKYKNELYWSKPVMKGIVQAETSKDARKYIKEVIFEREIKQGDDVLLSVMEIKDNTKYLKDFFEPRICKYCGRTFNNTISGFYSSEFCCENCYELYNYENLDAEKYLKTKEMNYMEFMDSNPVIYRIYNRISNKNYIGQTIRSFTLRWWEHCKSWIKLCPESITAFEFSILEEFTKEQVKSNPNLLSEREQYWIEKYDSLNNGYNSRNEKLFKEEQK